MTNVSINELFTIIFILVVEQLGRYWIVQRVWHLDTRYLLIAPPP